MSLIFSLIGLALAVIGLRWQANGEKSLKAARAASEEARSLAAEANATLARMRVSERVIAQLVDRIAGILQEGRADGSERALLDEDGHATGKRVELGGAAAVATVTASASLEVGEARVIRPPVEDIPTSDGVQVRVIRAEDRESNT